MHLEEPKTAEEELYMKGEKTKENLDVIAAYVNDFAAIVDDYANLHKWRFVIREFQLFWFKFWGTG